MASGSQRELDRRTAEPGIRPRQYSQLAELKRAFATYFAALPRRV